MKSTILFRSFALACTAALGVAACGGDDEKAEPKAVEDPQVQTEGTTTATNAAELKTVTGADEASKTKVHTLGQSLSSLRGSYVAYQGKTAAGSVAGAIPQGLEDPAGAAAGATPEVEYKDNHLTASFTYMNSTSGQEVVFNYIADMMIVPSESLTTIDGTFDLTYKINVNLGGIPGAGSVTAAAGGVPAGSIPESIQVEYEMHAHFESVSVGACPEAGTLSMDYKANFEIEGGNPAVEEALNSNPDYGAGTLTVTCGKDEAGAGTVSVEAI